MTRRSLLLAVLAMGAATPATAQSGPAGATPLAQFEVLTGGTWSAQGDGFSTALTYRWLLPGSMLEASNEVRGADGELLTRYRGAYIWDAGRGEVTFWTASANGEVHRGRAWWADDVLWHEAEVSGGAVDGYASAMRPTADGGFEYFAAYDRRDAGPYLLGTAPIVYTRAAAADGPLDAIAFMSGCWRGEFGGGAALEEYYSAPASNLMLGTSRFLSDDRVVQYEFSRISMDSAGVVLLPFPDGRPSAYAFRLTESQAGSALFEAPDHDFPKRIRYVRGADGSLTARIDGGEGHERVQEWRMRAVPCHPGT